jgi:RNA polymerase sigma-32 factor
MKVKSTQKQATFRSGNRSLEQYFSRVTRLPLMKPAEEQDIAALWCSTRDLKYKDRLVNANLRFVAKVAFEYENYGFPILDLIQEGNVGLVRAVDSYDPEKGYRLISYAVWWIRACIHDYILKNWSLVKLGTTQKQRAMFNRLVSSKKRLERISDTETPRYRQDIAETVGASTQEVHEFEMRMKNRPMALEDQAGGNDGGRSLSLHEVLPDDGEDVEASYAEEQIAQCRKTALAEALSTLTERERRIIVTRHLSAEKATFRELGDEMGVSKERVRQLEARALLTLRRVLSDSPMAAELLAA